MMIKKEELYLSAPAGKVESDFEPQTEDTPEQRALIVENEPDFAALIEATLSENGFSSTVSFDGEDALRQLRYRPPDLVTLDIGLPRKSGLLLFRTIRSDPKFRKIPVIVITGLSKDDRAMKDLINTFLTVEHASPPEAYVEKPFQKGELVDAVTRIFDS